MITEYMRLDHSGTDGEEIRRDIVEDDMASVNIEGWYARLHVMLSVREPMMINGRLVRALIWNDTALRVLIDGHCFDVRPAGYVFTDTNSSRDIQLQRMEHDIVLTFLNNRDRLIAAYDY